MSSSSPGLCRMLGHRALRLGRLTLALLAVATAGAVAAPVAGAVTISAPASAPLNSTVNVSASGTPVCWTSVQYSWSAGSVSATQGSGFSFTAAPAHAVIGVSVTASPTATDPNDPLCDPTPQTDAANVTVQNTPRSPRRSRRRPTRRSPDRTSPCRRRLRTPTATARRPAGASATAARAAGRARRTTTARPGPTPSRSRPTTATAAATRARRSSPSTTRRRSTGRRCASRSGPRPGSRTF